MCILQTNGDNGEKFQEVKLEAPGTPDNVSQDDSETGEGGGGGGERGERVHGEIAVLSPSQRPSAVTPTSGSGVPTVPESGVVSDEATSVKHEKSPRPDELNIKTFVPSKHLPTPSREAALTQKLEQALGM